MHLNFTFFFFGWGNDGREEKRKRKIEMTLSKPEIIANMLIILISQHIYFVAFASKIN